MILAAPSLLTDMGALAGSVAAVLGLIILLSRLRPVRWLWAQLVGEPVAEALRRVVGSEVAAATAELRPNGGSSIKDTVDRLERRQVRMEERQATSDEHLHRIDGRLESGDAHLKTIDGRLEVIEAQVETTKQRSR